MPSMNQAMRLLSRLNRDTSRNKAFSSITNKLVIFENILLDRGGGVQISTPIYRDTEPGVSCAKIGVQTVSIVSDLFCFYSFLLSKYNI